MSHHDSIQKHIPKVQSFGSVLTNASVSNTSEDTGSLPRLLIKGQGCVTFTIKSGTKQASITFANAANTERLVFRMFDKSIVPNGQKEVNFWYNGKILEPHEKYSKKEIIPADGYSLGIDANPKCVYWVSIDSLNKVLRYGKGEMRLSTVLAECRYDIPRDVFTRTKPERFGFIGTLQNISVENVTISHAWKEPVVVEPPVRVIPKDKLTMQDVAVKWTRDNPISRVTTPTSLSRECQTLYGNVAGDKFLLNTPDFPDFDEAIEYSLKTPGCLGYRIIDAKRGEFQSTPMASNLRSVQDDEYDDLYLRITLGKAQGNSPGVPYVMEIWPIGCGSPIHHHGFTNAIIRVLTGEIDVDIYRMLPEYGDSTKPLQSTTFKKGDITYLMPQANQFHRLRNNKNNSKSCITIQCYAYAKDDEIHYPKFDYVENGEEGHFEPISDCDYLKFKEKVREEWKKHKEEQKKKGSLN